MKASPFCETAFQQGTSPSEDFFFLDFSWETDHITPTLRLFSFKTNLSAFAESLGGFVSSS